jgi:hypothetical protein
MCWRYGVAHREVARLQRGVALREAEATKVCGLAGRQGRSHVRVHSVPCSRRVHSVRGALASQGPSNAQRLVDRQAQRVGAVVCGD